MYRYVINIVGVWALFNNLVNAQSFIAGHQVFTGVDEDRDSRELLTNIWYPVDAEDAVGRTQIQYYQHYNEGADFWWFDSPFEGGVQNATASAEGAFPLVVLSHGGPGFPQSFTHLGEALARAGYVAVAPRHTGHSWGTPDDENRQRLFRNRVIDLTFITDTMIDRSKEPGDILFGAVDENRIALGGYSAGVPTVAALSLGQMDLNDDLPVDDRARALLLLDGKLWWSQEEQTVELPTLLLGATVDAPVPLEEFNINAPTVHTLHIENSHHWSFGMNFCQWKDELAAANPPTTIYQTTGPPDRPDEIWLGCQDDLIDLDEALEIVAEKATTFFDAYLKNDEPLAVDLVPESAQNLKLTASRIGGNVDLLLTDPIGRRLGIDREGNKVDEFPGRKTRVVGNRIRSFTIAEADLVTGEYHVTASNIQDPEVMIDLEVQLVGHTGDHESTLTLNQEFSPNAEDRWTFELLSSVSVADCDSSGRLEAKDLVCVSTIPARDAVLSAIFSQPGDLDGDGSIAFADFLTLSGNFGTSDTVGYTDGDIDLNGVVGFEDFLQLSINFGKTAAETAAVPEPSGRSMLFLSVLFLPLVVSQIGKRTTTTKVTDQDSEF